MTFKTPSRLMAGVITLILLALYGFVLIVPAFKPEVKFDPALVQTLLTLVVVAVTYYIGTSNSSANKDETIQTQAATVASNANVAPIDSARAPAAPVSVRIDDSIPVLVDVVGDVERKDARAA